MSISREGRATCSLIRSTMLVPPAIDQDGAGAALAVITALLGPGEIEMQAQGVKQCRPRRDGELARDTIDMERDRDFRGRRKSFGLFARRRRSLRHELSLSLG